MDSSVHRILQARTRVGRHVLLQDLPDPGTEAAPLRSPELAGGFLTLVPLQVTVTRPQSQ